LLSLDYGGVDESKRLLFSAAILEAMDLISSISDGYECIRYIGPDVYTAFKQEQFDAHKQLHGLKKVSVRLSVIQNINESAMYDVKPPTFQSVINQLIAMGIQFEDENNRRSMQNRNVFCKCGHSEKPRNGSSNRSFVIVGLKKRVRCQKCAPCLTSKCNECQFCLKPSMKKSCEKRICVFPKVPNCPCFAQ
jgi:hypothetical protein